MLFYYSKLLSFEQLTKHKDHGRHKLKPISTASAESHPVLLHSNVILEQFFYEILPSIHEWIITAFHCKAKLKANKEIEPLSNYTDFSCILPGFLSPPHITLKLPPCQGSQSLKGAAHVKRLIEYFSCTQPNHQLTVKIQPKGSWVFLFACLFLN